jgi:AGZA family xanthine/uracil permease-like MFS transporter
MLEKLFHLKEYNTDIKTESIAGLTTFMTMAYIILVNPAILSVPAPNGAGMNFESVMAATAISAAIATMLMGLIANYPIALAPGMGMNALFSFTICGTMGVDWRIALGIVFISSVIFILLTFWGIRELIFNAIPDTIKYATVVGIGLFIAFIGLKDAGIVVSNPETSVSLGNLRATPTIISIIGIIIIAVLMSLNIRGSILIGIIISGIIGYLTGIVHFDFSHGIITLPSLHATIGKMNIKDAVNVKYIGAIFTVLFFSMFDAIGTLVGVTRQAGLMQSGQVPRLKKALFVDAIGSSIGAFLGTSPVTAYIESASGTAVGGRTGLTSIVTSIFLLLAIFFTPIAKGLGEGYISGGTYMYPVTAPALIIVGSLMMSTIADIQWFDPSEAIPAFLTITTMPLTYSISNGLAVGFLSYPVIKLLSGKGKNVHWLVYVIAFFILLRFIYL